jgi:hypothetical protein
MFAPLARVIREGPLVFGSVCALAVGFGLELVHASAVAAAAAGYIVGLYACLVALLQRYPAHRLNRSRWPTLRRCAAIALYVSPLYALAFVGSWMLTFTAMVSYVLGAGAVSVARRGGSSGSADQVMVSDLLNR